MALGKSAAMWIGMLFGVVVATVAADTVIAQGSTGGTLGKTDQSLSGGEQKAKRAKPASPAVATGGLCSRVPGAWNWKWAGFDHEVVFKSDGTGTANTGLTGTWTCSNGVVIVAWNNGLAADHLKLSPDGKQMTGTGGGFGTLATRR
jgi:hypothetical protein